MIHQDKLHAHDVYIALYTGFDKESAREFHSFYESMQNKEQCTKEQCSRSVGFGYSNKHDPFVNTHLSAYDMPTLVLMTKTNSFVFDKKKYSFNKDGFSKWYQDFLSGSISSYITSEDEPKEQGLVKQMTFNSFQSFFHKDKSLLIEFWKPQCAHCVALEPILDALALDYQGSKVEISKFNVVTNQVPKGLSIQFLPTILFYPNCINLDTFIEYRGERNFKDIRAFIEKNKCK